MAAQKLVKDAGSKVPYTEEMIAELRKCKNDPVYMMETYMRVLHPTRGEIPFKLYPYQKRMIAAYKSTRMCIALTGRQMGKCSTYHTTIKKDDVQIKIGELIPLTMHQKVVSWLEHLLLKLSTNL